MPSFPTATVSPGYKPQSSDTSIDADVLMFQLLRNFTPLQKIQRVHSFNKSLRRRCLDAIRSQYPDASTLQIRFEYIRRNIGDKWRWVLDPDKFQGVSEIVIEDPIEFARKIANILELLDIPFQFL